jgi:hypothetical protein
MVGFYLGSQSLLQILQEEMPILSHRACAVEASAYIAALCALIPSSSSREEAVMSALELIDKDSEAYEAVQIGIKNKR